MKRRFFLIPLLIPVLVEVSEAQAVEYSVKRDVVFTKTETGALRADMYLPRVEGPRPAVVVVHGGAWMGGNRRQLAWLARVLAEQGFVAMAINYRLAPAHPFPAQLEDCQAAVKWLKQNAETYHVDEDRVAAWGYSAGGHLAALLAVASPGLKAVIAGGAPYDFRSITSDNRMLCFWLGATRGENPQIYEAASPACFVAKGVPAFFMYHGRYDRIVPPIQAIQMAQLLKSAGATAEIFWTETGHVGTLFEDAPVEKAVEFLKEHLGEENEKTEQEDGQ